MIKSICQSLNLLLKNKRTYIILVCSIFITPMVSNNSWGTEGIKLIPSTIGILLGGLLTTIAIIFGVIKDSHIKLLTQKYGESFIESINNLKYHIFLILISLFITLISFFIKAPFPIFYLLDILGIDIIYVFFFTQIFFLLLTVYATIEVISILFLIFEIKFSLIKKEK